MSTPAARERSDVDDEILAKTRALLSHDSHRNERYLAVLVLLTRVSETQKLRDAWTPALTSFCVRLVRSRDAAARTCAVPLVSRLIPRLPAQNAQAWTDLGRALQENLTKRIEGRIPLDACDVDLVVSLKFCSDHAKSLLQEAMNPIWERFHQVVIRQDTVENQTEQGSESRELELMKSTLDAILAEEDHAATTDDLLSRFHKAILWFCNTSSLEELCKSSVPSWHRSMLEWLCATGSASSNNSLPEHFFLSWHELAMRVTMMLPISSSSSLETQQHGEIITKHLLMHVASPTGDLYLRSLAWTTLNALVQKSNDDWLLAMQSEAGSSSLGSASQKCALVRLASGEWRIQLGRVCSDDESLVESRAAVELSILESVAGFLLCQLQSIAKFANDGEMTDDVTLPFSADALFHLRQSFLDMFQTTIQYLFQPHQHVVSIQRLSSRVLGELLTEFDISSDLSAGVTVEEALHAVNVALQTMTEDSPGPLMPGLSMVFATTDAARLKKADLLGDTLIHFQRSFWKQAVNDESWVVLVSACQVVEHWHAAAAAKLKDTSQLSDCILGWIREGINRGPTQDFLSALPSVLDCVKVLLGESDPNQAVSAVVEQAGRYLLEHSNECTL